MWNRAVAVASVAGILLAGAATGWSHGIQGHMHVTGWAIENLPEGELRDFFADPAVMNAAIYGAAFTDSGYWPQGGELAARTRAYGEHTHWEPFIESFVQWIVRNDPPPWDDPESRMRVAFLMGCAAHGLQDEIFDSLYLYQVAEHDDGGQENADPGTDGFLALDGHLRFVPERWIPMETLLELYAELDVGVTEEDIEKAVTLMETVYVNDRAGPRIAESNGERYEPELPWTRAHYLDPAIPGSLRAEILPTMHYLQALWERLHGRLDPEDVVTFRYPELPRRLRSTDAASADSWVTLVFGIGVWPASAGSVFETLEGEPVAHRLEGTRWGGRESWSRLVRFQPEEDLVAGEHYRVGIVDGLDLIDGSVAEAEIGHAFQVRCETEDDERCSPLEEPAVPSIEGPAVDGSGEGSSEGSGSAEGSSDGVGSGEGSSDGGGLAEGSSDGSGLAEGSSEVEDPDAEPDDGGCSGTRFGGASPALVSGVFLALLLRRRNRAVSRSRGDEAGL